jgi:threonine dehydrogenase-like Zn-dependent dehydrogenase
MVEAWQVSMNALKHGGYHMSTSFESVSMMKELVYEAPCVMNIRQLPIPVPKSDEVLIRVEIAGICGSELSGYLGHNSLRKPPLVMGHEFAGSIAMRGSHVTRFQEGERVTVNPLVSCNRCRDCLSGTANLCAERILIGAGRPGAYAEYVSVPERNVYRLPDSLTYADGSLVEPFACAVRVCRLADASPADQMLIVGAGPIGLFVLQTAHLFGVTHITVMDTNMERLDIAKQLGANIVHTEAELIATSPARGYDITVDAVGMEVTRQTCMKSAKPGGRVVFSGLHAADSMLPINLSIRNELKMFGSFGYTPYDFELALDWLVARKVDLKPWTVTESLLNGQACFERLLHQPGKIAKILLTCQAL